jgi:S-adenosylmethionine/arginine decarboxylase-like enzyme
MATTTQNITVPGPSDLQPWGFHAIMDCSNCELDKIQDETNIKNWLEHLTTEIGMTPAGGTIVLLTTDDDPAKSGLTGVQILNTGMISAQFVDEPRQIYVDIFSSKQYNPQVAELSIKQFFGDNTEINKILFPRNAGASAHN